MSLPFESMTQIINLTISCDVYLAYTGPGAGLSMLGALFAVGSVLILALIAPILYPLVMLRSWLKKKREATKPADIRQ